MLLCLAGLLAVFGSDLILLAYMYEREITPWRYEICFDSIVGRG